MDVAGRKVTKRRPIGVEHRPELSAPTIPQTPNTLYKGLRCADSTPVSKHAGPLNGYLRLSSPNGPTPG